MPANPFFPLTRKAAAQAALGRLKAACLRPLRPARIAAGRDGPPNLLLLGIDTLRYDHLGAAGYGLPTTPHLDRLGGGGTFFTDVTAPAPWTLPSFSSALCGLMPGLHGAFLPGDTLPGNVRNMDTQPPRTLQPGVVTLADHLGRQGYRTAAFYANPFFAFGLAESFQEHHYYNFAAPDLARAALEWIRRHADGPFFCFVLFNDPHEPTTPPAADLAPFLRELPGQGPWPAQMLRDLARWGGRSAPALGLAPWPLDEETGRALALKTAIYDGTIRLVDRTVGVLQDRLRHWGLQDSTLVSVFADHGEEFLDHAGWARTWDHDPRPLRGIGHGHAHFQEVLHVPWLAWGPGVPAGVRRTEPASLLDLSPTLLDWLGLPPLPLQAVRTRLAAAGSAPAAAAVTEALVGVSQANPPALAPAGVAAPAPPRLVLAEAIAYGPDLVALRRGSWKLIAHRDGRPLALFDLREEPREMRDLAAAQPAVVDGLLADLGVWRAMDLRAAPGRNGPQDGPGDRPEDRRTWQDLDATVRQRLKDLGYTE